jgi:hypothetical protein
MTVRPLAEAVDLTTARRTTVRTLAIAGVQAVLIAAALFVFLRGWQRDPRVPLVSRATACSP